MFRLSELVGRQRAAGGQVPQSVMQRALSSLLAWHLVLVWCAILPAEIGAQPAIGNCSIPGTVQFQASQDIPAQKAAVTTFFTSVWLVIELD